MSPEVREPRNPAPVGRTERPAEGAAASPAPRPDKPSPVDQILATPVGKSKLDTRPSEGAVPKWTWLLPFIFLLPGGIVGWLVVRGTNRTAGRMMLVIGVAMTILTVLSLRPVQELLRAGG